MARRAATHPADEEYDWGGGKLPHSAVEHVCRLVRLLRSQWELGHVLMVGEASSSRHALLALACSVLDVHCKVLSGRRVPRPDVGLGGLPVVATAAATAAGEASQGPTAAALLAELRTVVSNRIKAGTTQQVSACVRPVGVSARALRTTVADPPTPLSVGYRALLAYTPRSFSSLVFDTVATALYQLGRYWFH